MREVRTGNEMKQVKVLRLGVGGLGLGDDGGGRGGRAGYAGSAMGALVL